MQVAISRVKLTEKAELKWRVTIDAPGRYICGTDSERDLIYKDMYLLNSFRSSTANEKLTLGPEL